MTSTWHVSSSSWCAAGATASNTPTTPTIPTINGRQQWLSQSDDNYFTQQQQWKRTVFAAVILLRPRRWNDTTVESTDFWYIEVHCTLQVHWVNTKLHNCIRSPTWSATNWQQTADDAIMHLESPPSQVLTARIRRHVCMYVSVIGESA